nr:putative peptidoglycan glycosyltransferase FtsW [Corynebacterium lactis]
MDNSRKARDLSSGRRGTASGATAGSVRDSGRPGRKAPAADQREGARPGSKIVAYFNDWKSRPLFDYSVLLIVIGLLTFVGLVMVLSASMASSGRDSGSVWSVFIRQVIMVFGGLVSMWFVLKLRVEFIRAMALPALLLSGFLLVLVLIPGVGIGLEETGARSWLSFGGFTMQPSELAKIALALWGARFLADRVRTAVTKRELFGPFLGVSIVVLGLVVAQKDLGMMASMALMVVALAWFAGLPRIFVTSMFAFGGVAFVMFTLLEGFRSARIRVYVDSLLGNFSDVQGDAYQSYQGFLSLADGSMTGVGLGQSAAKWFYLPEAKNDFIFAIIGEELGFLGAGLVILLYAALGWVGLRIAGRQHDPFLRLLAATLTTATVVQAFINIGYVVGALPVTGLQLPLISAGGTSALVTLLSMGLLATCARHESEAVSAMQTEGRPLFDRILGIPEPHPYDESLRQSQKIRAHRDPQQFGPPVKVSGARADGHARDIRPRPVRGVPETRADGGRFAGARDSGESRAPWNSRVARGEAGGGPGDPDRRNVVGPGARNRGRARETFRSEASSARRSDRPGRTFGDSGKSGRGPRKRYR